MGGLGPYMDRFVVDRTCGSKLCGPHSAWISLSHIEEVIRPAIAASTGIKAFTHHESRSVCGCGDEGDPVGPIPWDRSLLISVECVS